MHIGCCAYGVLTSAGAFSATYVGWCVNVRQSTSVPQMGKGSA